MSLLIFTLAGAGAAVSLLMLGLRRGVLHPDSPLLPRFCRMDGADCRRVMDHPHGRILGVPNALPGLVYYIAVAVAGATGEETLLSVARAAAWVSVGVGAALAWSLLVVIRTPCPLCWTAHGVNLLLALLLTFRDAV